MQRPVDTLQPRRKVRDVRAPTAEVPWRRALVTGNIVLSDARLGSNGFKPANSRVAVRRVKICRDGIYPPPTLRLKTDAAAVSVTGCVKLPYADLAASAPISRRQPP